MTTQTLEKMNSKKNIILAVPTCILAILLCSCQPLANGMQSVTDSINQRIENNPTTVTTPDIAQSKIVRGKSYRLIIEGQRVTCDTAKPMQCLLAKVGSTDNTNSENTNNKYIKIAYDKIYGFKANTDIRYIIDAQPFVNTETNAATGNWQLVEVLSQQPVR